MVDLASTTFWGMTGAATLAMTPLDRASLRRLMFASLNLAFLCLLLGRHVPVVLAVFLLGWMLLQLSGGVTWRRMAAGVALGAALLLFALHKLPGLSQLLHVTPVNPLLATVGYAYIFLRFTDVLRAVWEGRDEPPGPIQLFNYLMPFHMLAAGPIQSWEDYANAPALPPPPTLAQSLTAVELIVRGLFKKFVLAFLVAATFSTHWRAGGWYRILEMNACYMWLFLDFSAYSDIALGIGELIGIRTPLNFDRPYLSRNITDFWERWHISLSRYIRRNLFLPLHLGLMRRTGGRFPLLCASAAIFVAFVLCGVWHDLTLPFLTWGVYNALGLVVCNLYREWLKRRLGTKGVKAYLASPWIRIGSTILTFEFVAFGIMMIAEYGGNAW